MGGPATFMVTLTVWLSTVVLTGPEPELVPVNEDVAVPLLVVVLKGLTLPSVPPEKVTVVPSGTL
jgi:hypothetical protein